MQLQLMLINPCLQLASYDKELTDLAFNACSYLTELMALYSRIESRYHAPKSQAG